MAVFASDIPLRRSRFNHVCSILSLCLTTALVLNVGIARLQAAFMSSWAFLNELPDHTLQQYLHWVGQDGFMYSNDMPLFPLYLNPSSIGPLYIGTLVVAILLLGTFLAFIATKKRGWLWGVIPLALLMLPFVIITLFDYINAGVTGIGPPHAFVSILLIVLLLLTVLAGAIAGRSHWLWGVFPLAVFLMAFFVFGYNQLSPWLIPRTPPSYYAVCWLTGSVNDKSLWVFLVYGALTAIAAACCILSLVRGRQK